MPSIRSVSDGLNQSAARRIETRIVKMILEEVTRLDEINAVVGGLPVMDLETMCTDPHSRDSR